ncbi:hypothetical protein T03_7527 [Trichinella britovi]|uniref:Uncharacterized protein n=1 Tax=Trichinella britovi TaxID=45882 RepID=A0A0V1CY69_TRIBR|nr:hypothetical protein T03_7527 [Trichinella britovi]
MNGNFSLQMLLPAINGSSKLKLGLYTHAWWCIFKLVNRIWLLEPVFGDRADFNFHHFESTKREHFSIHETRNANKIDLNMPNKMMHGSCDRRSRNRLATPCSGEGCIVEEKEERFLRNNNQLL